MLSFTKSRLAQAIIILLLALPILPICCVASAEKGKKKNGEWYVRLIVSTNDGREDRGNILGRLRDSVQGMDSHDLPEMPPPPSPMGDRYLSIMFPHPEWKTAMPDYSSDFRAVPAKGDIDETWKFEIQTHTPGIPAQLTWEGPAEVLGRSRIREAGGNVLVANCALQKSLTVILKNEGVVFIWEYQAKKKQEVRAGDR